MTLLTTEIHQYVPQPAIIFAADQRISTGDITQSNKEKIFRLGNRQAAMGYFGLAQLPAAEGKQPMKEWVKDFIGYHVKDNQSIEQIALNLAGKLNELVPKSWHKEEVSGFHVAGFNQFNEAEFWYVRNIDDYGMPTLGKYEAREDYNRRDRANLSPGQVQIYRNGDIRAHIAAWGAIDESFGGMLRLDDFKPITSLEEYVRWVKFKMELIAKFYSSYSKSSIIGDPIDAFGFTATEFFEGV